MYYKDLGADSLPIFKALFSDKTKMDKVKIMNRLSTEAGGTEKTK